MAPGVNRAALPLVEAGGEPAFGVRAGQGLGEANRSVVDVVHVSRVRQEDHEALREEPILNDGLRPHCTSTVDRVVRDEVNTSCILHNLTCSVRTPPIEQVMKIRRNSRTAGYDRTTQTSP